MSQTSLKFFTVDAFTSTEFRGNPAAVCLIPQDFKLNDIMMQKIASETNLSETAFLSMTEKTTDFKMANTFRLRWFSRTNEVDLCGHATLATASVLFHKIGNKNSVITFETAFGILKASLQMDRKTIELEFPYNMPCTIRCPEMSKIAKTFVQNLTVEDILISKTTKKLLIILDKKYKRPELELLKTPNVHELLSLHDGSAIRAVIISVLGDNSNNTEGLPKYDFYSRYFAPWNGILEDPVCGSAHTVLAPYWGKKLKKSNMKAYQCSARGGEIGISIKNIDDELRVLLYGETVHVFEGIIEIPDV